MKYIIFSSTLSLGLEICSKVSVAEICFFYKYAGRELEVKDFLCLKNDIAILVNRI